MKFKIGLVWLICIVLMIFFGAFIIYGQIMYGQGYVEGSTNNLSDNETCVISETNDSINLSKIYENMTGVNFYNYQVKLLDEFDRPIKDIACDLFLVEIAEITSNEWAEYKLLDESISDFKGDCIFNKIPAKSNCINISVGLNRAGIPGILSTELCGDKTEEYYVSKEEGLSYKYILNTRIKESRG